MAPVVLSDRRRKKTMRNKKSELSQLFGYRQPRIHNVQQFDEAFVVLVHSHPTAQASGYLSPPRRVMAMYESSISM